MKKRIGLLMLLLLITSGIAEAQTMGQYTKAETWEFSVQTRYSWGKDFTSDNGSKLELDDDLGWGFGFGYNLSDAFNLGMVFTWRSVYYQATLVNATDPSDTQNYSNQMDTSTFGLTADYTLGKKRFQPYVTGNMGWLRVNTNIVAGVSSGCWYYPYWGYVCGSYPTTYGTDSFAYGLGLGGRFQLTPTAYLKVGWDHNWSGLDDMDSFDFLRVDIGFRM